MQLVRATQPLSRPDCIVTSPLKRCHYFAKDQATKLECELLVNPQLQEMNFGQWDGVPYSQHSPHWPAMTAFWQSPANTSCPEGESLQIMQARVKAAWNQILELKAENLWVVTHGGVIRLLLAHILKLDWRNAQLYSTLAVNYASRTTLTINYFESKPTIRVQAISVPAPEA